MLPLRIGLACAGCLIALHAAFGEVPEIPAPALGLALPPGSSQDAVAAKDPAHPLDVLVQVDWSAIETSPGVFDWSAAAAEVAALTGRGAHVTLRVGGESPLHVRDAASRGVPDGAWIQAYTELLRSAVRALGNGVAVVEIGDHPERGFEAPAYAFLLKSASLAVKAEAKARGLELRVAQGIVGSDALAWQKTLWDNDAAPYIDVLPVEFPPGAEIAAVVTAFAEEAALHPPAAALRADVLASGDDDWSALCGAIEALAASAAGATVPLPSDPGHAESIARVVEELQQRLAADYAPAPHGSLALRAPEGGPVTGGAICGRFLHAKDFATLLVYRAAPTGDPQGQARLLLDTPDVKDPEVVDLLSGASYKTGPATVPGEKARALRLLLAAHPLAVRWDRAAVNQPGLEMRPEDVNVKTTRGLTAEEIIAKNRQVQKIEDDHLLRWIGKGRADIHFKISDLQFDVAIESTYFWQKGAKLEWQQTRYFVNGNVVKWKKIPELPLIQPEKVVTLPLELTFDKTYDYKLAGEDKIAGRQAYIVAFEPTGALAAKSLYRGRVWIDKETFVRLKTSVLQTNLEAPVLQNEEVDTYVPVTGPDGTVYHLIGKTDGQQLWSGAGRNFVVRRELSFTSFDINTPEDAFDQSLKSAYASSDQMLQDTDTGFRYLEKRPNGERVVQEHPKTDALFALAGAMKDDSTAHVLPLAGVNWFDYDLFKKKIQLEVFFAGALGFVNLTDPAVGGSKVDLGVESFLDALKHDDKLFTAGVEDVTQRVRRRSNRITSRFGHPLGNFFKVTLIGRFIWNAYEESSDAQEALASYNAANPGNPRTFVLPSNHFLYSGTLQLEFNRMGYTVTAVGGASRRSHWEPWGLYDTTGPVERTFDPSQQSFQTWELTAFKEWYLPKAQKLSAEVEYLDGRNLDRFSQYNVGVFGNESIAGFAGTGVRFDTGTLVHGGWAFNIANVVRFNASVDYGHVRDRIEDDQFRNHTGAGVSFNVPGPWKTIWQGSYGRAIKSDVAGLEGKQEFRFVVLILLGK